MSNYKLKILSLGAGVQSSTLLLMACKGIIEKPNLAIFADTGWESEATMKHLAWLKQEARKAAIEIIIVSNGSIKERYSQNTRHPSMPFFVLNGNRKGMMHRQCTSEHKINPIKKYIRFALGLLPRQIAPKDCVEEWIGISIDEAHRSFGKKKDRMMFLRYPLIEMGFTRIDCERWLWSNYQIIVPKSSCIGCPFHSDTEWQNLTREEFKDACEFDNHIRTNAQMSGVWGTAYIHRSCKPLEEVDFRSEQEIMEQDYGQQVLSNYWVKDEKLNLFINNISINNG